MTSPVWSIDGSLVSRTILRIALRRAGIASTGYSQGQEALRDLRALDSVVPGLMLIEGRLPDTDGYEVIAQVRRLLSRRQTAIVVLSNRSGIVDRLKGLLAGADDYLTKPFLVADVRAVVGKHLQRIERSRATAAAADFQEQPIYP